MRLLPHSQVAQVDVEVVLDLVLVKQLLLNHRRDHFVRIVDVFQPAFGVGS